MHQVHQALARCGASKIDNNTAIPTASSVRLIGVCTEMGVLTSLPARYKQNPRFLALLHNVVESFGQNRTVEVRNSARILQRTHFPSAHLTC